MSIDATIEELTKLLEKTVKALNDNTAAMKEMPLDDGPEEPEDEEPEEPEDEGPEEQEEEEEPKSKARKTTKKAAPKKATPKKNTIKLEEVRDAIRRVSDEIGRAESRAILTDFDIKRVTDLKETDYKDFIEACEEALAEHADDEA